MKTTLESAPVALLQPPRGGTVVLGMHRSGTSAVTQLLHGLGGAVCDPSDRLSGHEQGRPVAYWESRSTVVVNEAILGAFGGDWSVPPDLAPGWWTGAAARRLVPVATDLFWSVHPSDGWLCKDPRLCLTLPWWSAWVLPKVRVVLVVRHPVAVAASLARRDGLDPRHGLWLWGRYTRAALQACRGLPAMVISYDHLCRDRLATATALRDWAFPAGDAGLLAAAGGIQPRGELPEPATTIGRPAAGAVQLYTALAAHHGHLFPPTATP